MIIETLLGLVFGLIGFLINLIPDFSGLNFYSGIDISGFLDILSYGFVIFPFPLFIGFIGNVLFWLVAQMVWAIVEWLYRKIPGVN